MCVHRNTYSSPYVTDFMMRLSEFLRHWMSVMKYDVEQTAEYLGIDATIVNDILSADYDGTTKDCIAILERCGYHLEFKFLHN